MKTKTNPEISDLSKKLLELRNELSRLSFEMVQGKVKDVHKGRKLHKQIAQVLTRVHEVGYATTDQKR